MKKYKDTRPLFSGNDLRGQVVKLPLPGATAGATYHATGVTVTGGTTTGRNNGCREDGGKRYGGTTEPGVDPNNNAP